MTLASTSFVAGHAIYLVAAIPLVISIVVALVVWRNGRREEAAQSLRLRLASSDPEVRRRALDDVTDDVLSANASMLCELLTVERDPDVLDALAAAVARSRWEPSNDPSLVELRRWVAGGQSRATRASGDVDAREEVVVTTPAPSVAGPATETPLVTGGVATVVATRPAGPPTDLDATDVVVAHEAATGADATGAEHAPSPDDLAELVPKVRAVLGGALDRLELVSIDGEVLTTWSAGEAPGGADEGAG